MSDYYRSNINQASSTLDAYQAELRANLQESNNQSSYLGGLNAAQKTEPKLFEQMRGKIDAETMKATEAAALLGAIADRAFGLAEDAVQAGEPCLAVSIHAGEQEIWNALTRLENTLNRVLSAAKRFDRLA